MARARFPEREGTFTNLERRLQKLEPVVSPPGTARDAWRVCADLARALGDAPQPTTCERERKWGSGSVEITFAGRLRPRK
jgi:predicted molibdopterin-dependent oxidoreductase YjgC